MPVFETDKTRRADARKSRKLILDAARVLFRHTGSKVSLESVIQAAGVGRATFFRHFPNREQLMIELVSEALDELVTKVQALSAQPDLFELFLSLYIDTIVQHIGVMEYWSQEQQNGSLQQLIYQRVVEMRERIVLLSDQQVVKNILSAADIILFGRMLIGAALREPASKRESVLSRAAEMLLDGVRPVR